MGEYVLRQIALLVITISIAASALAHHSGAEFDRERVVVIEGSVMDYDRAPQLVHDVP